MEPFWGHQGFVGNIWREVCWQHLEGRETSVAVGDPIITFVGDGKAGQIGRSITDEERQQGANLDTYVKEKDCSEWLVPLSHRLQS